MGVLRRKFTLFLLNWVMMRVHRTSFHDRVVHISEIAVLNRLRDARNMLESQITYIEEGL